MFRRLSKPLPGEQSVLLFFLSLGLMTLWVVIQVEIPMLLGMRPDWEQRVAPYITLLHLHAGVSMLALLAGPPLFISGLRASHPHWHRRIGYVYAVSVAIAAVSAIWIAAWHLPPGENLAHIATGLVWLLSTGAAVQAAIRKRFNAHQRWIYRSYALTTTFVISRMLVDVGQWQLPSSVGGNTSALWIYILLALVAAEFIPYQPVKAGSRSPIKTSTTAQPIDDAGVGISNRHIAPLFATRRRAWLAGVLLLAAAFVPSAVLVSTANHLHRQQMDSIARIDNEIASTRAMLKELPSDPVAHLPLLAPFFSTAINRQPSATLTVTRAKEPDATNRVPLGEELPIDKLQRRLAALGYNPGPVDGLLGARTRRALLRFQRQQGLDATGRINAATATALMHADR